MTQDFSKRFAIVLRSDIEAWQTMNAACHIAARLGRAVGEFDTGEKFTTKNGFSFPRNSQYPIIIFKTKENKVLQKMLEELRVLDIPYLAFIREMIDFTDDAELQKSLDHKSETELEYLGVGVFGDNEILKKLTKKFSLWK